MTNSHVINKADDIAVFTQGSSLPAKVVMNDPRNDLALVQLTGIVPEGHACFELGDALTMHQGDPVFALGYPLPDEMGDTLKLTDGIINSLRGLHNDPRTFQVSTPIQPGNSGGPLINVHGQVVGVTSSSLADLYSLARYGSVPQNVNYAIKSAYVNLLALMQKVPDCPKPIPASDSPLTARSIYDHYAPAVVRVEVH